MMFTSLFEIFVTLLFWAGAATAFAGSYKNYKSRRRFLHEDVYMSFLTGLAILAAWAGLAGLVAGEFTIPITQAY